MPTAIAAATAAAASRDKLTNLKVLLLTASRALSVSPPEQTENGKLRLAS